jgi:hypothetical protein
MRPLLFVFTGQVRILRERLERTPAKRATLDVARRSKQDNRGLQLRLGCQELSNAVHKLGVEGGRDSRCAWQALRRR